MLKMFVFWLLLQPWQFNALNEVSSYESCNLCPTVTNVQGSTSIQGTYSLSWNAVPSAIEYKVWYVRHSDGYTSAEFATLSSGWVFPSLTSGTHTFYIKSVCENGTTNFIGVEDLIEF